ncbi:MAG: hypothetical protein K6F61_05835 [Clostridiales bacterium]|nr:hypothetical protein [Clostridia bacterium]MCR5566352.1 hypothetical protein [Clostridiales bacterium]
MKHVLILILALALLIPCGAGLAEWEWEGVEEGGQFRLNGQTTGTLLEDASALNPRTGPGLIYDAVDPRILVADRGEEIRILSQVYSGGILWVLAEIPSFYSSDVRCYLIARNDSQKIRFNEAAVPLETGPDELLSEWQCSCYEYQAYRFGPGDSYAFTGGALSPDDNAWVILMDGDWALVESSNRYDGATAGIFARRGWVRFSTLIY